MRRLVPFVAAVSLLALATGTAMAASPPSHVVQGPIGCTTLDRGDYGFPVRVLQGDLAQLGLFYGKVTGFFGQGTFDGLRRFQGENGLPTTGVFNTATLLAIKDAMHIDGPSPRCTPSTPPTKPTVSASSTASSTPNRFFHHSTSRHTSGSSSVTNPRTEPSRSSSTASSTQPGTSSSSSAVPSTKSSTSSSSTASSTAPSSTGLGTVVKPLQGIIAPTPAVAIDYEYTWFSPGFSLTASCSSQEAFGKWDADNGYAGIVMDLGDPLGLERQAGNLAQAESTLRTAETCYTDGFTSASGNIQPLIYVGFSNCVPAAGSSGSCGATATNTSIYTTAGKTVGAYVSSGTADVQGTWLDFESDWSTMSAIHAEVLGYLSENPAHSGHGQWCDSTYRNYASGSPNDTWTVANMLDLYVDPVVNAGYTCLGSQHILIPQAYNASWLTNGSANFSPNSGLTPYVGGITVCGAVESTDSCPDLGIPSGSSKWTDYASDGYEPAADSVVAVVTAEPFRIPL